jgi:putative transposase
MPRSARIDIEGVLQHVMIRGIERRDIFVDDRDRLAFVERFTELLVKTKTDCLAWSLLSNHAHLLLRPTKGKLAEMMKRLLTGYAMVFNLRYHRSGHLFQNRYKSIVCDEDSYLLELVRYIHLNPIRAGLVQSIDKLETFRWSGHAVIMGHFVCPGQVTEEVLQLFDDNKKRALKKYREFVKDGIALGKRDELVGGGLKRYLKLSGSQDFEAYDERILGSGDFVEEIWHETELPTEQTTPPPSLGYVIELVASVFGVSTAALRQGCKEKHVSEARGAICFIAIRRFGYHGTELAKNLGISESGVVLAARRGEALFNAKPILTELFTLKQLK